MESRGGISNLPNLDEEARRRNLDLAIEARRVRSVFCKQLKAGELDPVAFLSEPPVQARKIRVVNFLKACPGIGDATASRIMNEVDIAPTRRLSGLGSRQKERLADLLRERFSA